MKTRTRIAMAAALLVAMCIAGSADAALLALDDFSSGTNNGGTGWAGAWDDTTMSFSTASPFANNVSAGYLWDNSDIAAPRRSLATSLLPATTPEVWVGAYLRPTNASGWQFGFEINNGDWATTYDGAQAGKMHGDGSQTVMLARANAEARTGSGNTFTANQPTLLAMRVYKNNPGDSVYNRADLYADMNGNDGRYNNPVTIATGLDLSNRAASNLGSFRLLTDTTVDFDYVAVGTTLADVTNPGGGAGTIGLDMDDAGGPVTEPGFASVTVSSPTATIGGVTFTIGANPTSGALTSRDRGATTQSPSDVLRDFVFDANWGGPLGLFLDVSGMAAGTYDVESWHYDKNNGERTDITFDMVFSQNATEAVVASGHWTTDALSYQITTDGSDFTMEYRDTWSASSDTRINGITFTPVGGGPGDDIPEPATMCALGLAVAGLGGYVRRRRKRA